MFQYDATRPGKFGGGGEYEVQEGFGWTNGVVFEFLDTYPWATYNEMAMLEDSYCKFSLN